MQKTVELPQIGIINVTAVITPSTSCPGDEATDLNDPEGDKEGEIRQMPFIDSLPAARV